MFSSLVAHEIGSFLTDVTLIAKSHIKATEVQLEIFPQFDTLLILPTETERAIGLQGINALWDQTDASRESLTLFLSTHVAAMS